MRRREFIKLLGGAAAAWPLTARAQQPMPVIGLLGLTSEAERIAHLAAFRRGLKEAGYEEGQNVTVEYSWAQGQRDRLAGLAADLVRRQVTVIFATDGAVTALAAKAATEIIPIVFTNGSDPVEVGLVASLSRPGGNVTGTTFLSNALAAKRLTWLRELIPAMTSIGLLVNPTNPNSVPDRRDLEAAAQVIGLQMHVREAMSEGEIQAAFSSFTQQGTSALIVSGDPFIQSQTALLVQLAARHAIPTGYSLREYVVAGGLMSYGASQDEAYRLGGTYTARVLNGTKPSELPVLLPAKFDLVINLKTAKALGLTVPQTFLMAADVIE
jgi:putative ABC transport system substrate-binding protein